MKHKSAMVTGWPCLVGWCLVSDPSVSMPPKRVQQLSVM